MRPFLAVALVLAALALAHADCATTCDVPGGGSARTDCLVEFGGVPGTRVRCIDGDPTCDSDGAVNGACRFAVTACLGLADADLPKCTAGEVASFRVRNGWPGSKKFIQELATLESSVASALPATSTCRPGVPVYVALRGKKRFKPGTLHLRTQALATDGRKDVDGIALTCVPSPILGTPTSAYAFARTITNPAELIGGALSRGRLGDTLLANERIQVVIQAPGRSCFTPALARDATARHADDPWQYGYSSTASLAPERFMPYTLADAGETVLFRYPGALGSYPYVAFNPTKGTITDPTDSWAVRPGELALEGSNDGRYSLVRFVCPRSGRYRVTADFAGIHFRSSSTDVHVLVGARSAFDADIDGYGGDPKFHDRTGSHPTARYEETLSLSTGDVLTFAVGYGPNRTHFNDTTGLRLEIDRKDPDDAR
jgi:hypothetical protein